MVSQVTLACLIDFAGSHEHHLPVEAKQSLNPVWKIALPFLDLVLKHDLGHNGTRHTVETVLERVDAVNTTDLRFN